MFWLEFESGQIGRDVLPSKGAFVRYVKRAEAWRSGLSNSLVLKQILIIPLCGIQIRKDWIGKSSFHCFANNLEWHNPCLSNKRCRAFKPSSGLMVGIFGYKLAHLVLFFHSWLRGLLNIKERLTVLTQWKNVWWSIDRKESKCLKSTKIWFWKHNKTLQCKILIY